MSGFGGERVRKIHSFTLLTAITASDEGGGGAGDGCGRDGSCCCGGCSGADGSGSVSTGASVVSYDKKKV